MKLVSVVIPVYNSENTIIRCLNSVCNQTYKDIELILVNDGSTDNSCDLIHDFFENSDINYILYTQQNKGVSSARNQGIKLSSGDYIAFLDSDDYWKNDKLEKQVYFLEENRYSIAGACSCGNDRLKNNCGVKIFDFKDMLYSNRLSTSSVVVRRDVLTFFNGFDETMSFSEDYNLWLKIAYEYPICVLQEPLIYYNNDEDNSRLSFQLWKMEKGELLNYFLLFKENKITFFQYVYFSSYSFCKFLRRYIYKAIR